MMVKAVFHTPASSFGKSWLRRRWGNKWYGTENIWFEKKKTLRRPEKLKDYETCFLYTDEPEDPIIPE